MIDVMKGRMIEADFSENTLTFRMSGLYEAYAGTFYIIPEGTYREFAEKAGLPKPERPGSIKFIDKPPFAV